MNFIAYPSTAAAERAAEANTAACLSGKTVLLVHPAWHSCGSHKVFVMQAQAYRALGAKVISVALADAPARHQDRLAQAYHGATQDLQADQRHFASMPLRRILRPSFLKAHQNWLHGNYAAMAVEVARSVSLPTELLESADIDLIHCNHFFCMAAAVKLRANRRCPILLDTHDLQARQYKLRQAGSRTRRPTATYESMLALELANMAAADILIHLNAEEAATFEQLMPDKRHVLVFPAVEPMSTGRGGSSIIIVASANYPNLLSVIWFLNEVLPLVPDTQVKIVGNIDQEFRRRAPALYRQHAALFTGYRADLEKVYSGSAAVLLPITEGCGISIKTIEALSSGAPLIATRHAFRGMGIDPARLSNVTLAADAREFAAAIRRVSEGNRMPPDDRMHSDTRRLYEQLFSPSAYRQSLAALAVPLLESERKPICSATR